MTVELVVVAPILFLFAMVAIGMGRYEMARSELVGSARAGAEAASGAPSAPLAQWVAQTVAVPAIYGAVHSCADPVVTTDTSDFVAGGKVVVVVTCTVDNSDLLLPGMPGHSTISVSVTAPVDPYRAVGE